MLSDAHSVYNDFVQWMIGRKVERASLSLNSLTVCIEGEYGKDTGLFMWFDPVWQVGSPRGILVGSRQAQVEELDAHAALDLLVQELLGRQVERVSVETGTSQADFRFSGGYWLKTFVSDPTDQDNWYIRNRQKNLIVSGSTKGLRLETYTPPSGQGKPLG